MRLAWKVRRRDSTRASLCFVPVDSVTWNEQRFVERQFNVKESHVWYVVFFVLRASHEED